MRKQDASGTAPASGAKTADGSHAVTQAIGLDLGGTKLHAGTATPDGEFGADILEPTEAASEDRVLAQIVAAIRRLRDGRPRAVAAIGVPGAVDPARGTLNLSPNIPFAPDRRLGQVLQEATGIPVAVENDVNLAALAEARLGAGRGLDLVCFLSFGTGVGLGVISDGRVLHGANGRAGEIGYLPLARDPIAAAAASAAGQFEDLVGAASIRQRYGRDLPDVRTLFARADDGDGDAVAAIAATATAAAQGLASLQSLLDPNLIVIGGGIGMQKRFYDRLCAEAEKLLPFPITVSPAELGAAAGVLGALVLAGDSAGLPNLRIGANRLPPPAPTRAAPSLGGAA